MRGRIFLRIGTGLGIDDEVAVGLLVQGDVLLLCRATSGKPILVKSERSNSMSGAVYSTNSKPSVPIGFSRPNGPFSATCVAIGISFGAQLLPRRPHFKLRESSPNFALTAGDSFALATPDWRRIAR